MQESILHYFQSISSLFLDGFFSIATMLGEQYVIIAVIAWVYWNVSKKEGFLLTYIFLISTLVNSLLKVAFQTKRPFQVLEDIAGKRVHTATGYSFPSGLYTRCYKYVYYIGSDNKKVSCPKIGLQKIMKNVNLN